MSQIFNYSLLVWFNGPDSVLLIVSGTISILYFSPLVESRDISSTMSMSSLPDPMNSDVNIIPCFSHNRPSAFCMSGDLWRLTSVVYKTKTCERQERSSRQLPSYSLNLPCSILTAPGIGRNISFVISRGHMSSFPTSMLSFWAGNSVSTAITKR